MTTVQIRQRGTLTLPVELRHRYGIEQGDTFQVVDLDGVFVLTPMPTRVAKLAQEIEDLRLEAGLDMADLLENLRTIREEVSQERYGSGES